MGKFFGPMIEYCWDIAWALSFNNKVVGEHIPVVFKNEDGSESVEYKENTSYDHNLIIYVELQDENREKIDIKECTIKLHSTREMLNLAARLDFVFLDETKQKVAETITVLKEQFSGYVQE